MATTMQAVLKREVPWALVRAYLLCSALCTVMVLYRYAVTGATTYLWLAVPNLVLAWMPFGFAAAIRVIDGLGWRKPLPFLALGLLWLLFFPNAPYIVTDLVHLMYMRDGISIYFDVAVITLAAWTGLGLGFSSLLMLQELVERAWGRLAGWSFTTVIWVLTAMGIYLGRVERWNSWEMLLSPLRILSDLAAALRSGETLLIILVYAVVNMALYLTFRSFVTQRAG